MDTPYDTIGLDYARLRRPDPRIAARIATALKDAQSVLNVGAGAGSYEPRGRAVTAVEPSAAMNAQRPAHRPATVVQASAEALPFADDAFDAAMAVLTVHHWDDPRRGLMEMVRVSRGPVVVLTHDPAFRDVWLLDYLPALRDLDQGIMPGLDELTAWLPGARIEPVAVPHDCRDGFLYAYWRRPAAYLDARVRAAMSPFHALGDGARDGLDRLERDLADGTFSRRYRDVLQRDSLDVGYRLLVRQAGG